MDERPTRRRLMYSPEEAADLLGVSRTTVYGLMKDAELHRIHIGRSCRISDAELVRFVSDRDRRSSTRRAKNAGAAVDEVQQALFGSDNPQPVA